MRLLAITLGLASILSACRCIPPQEPPVPKNSKELSLRWSLVAQAPSVPLKSFRADRINPELSIEEAAWELPGASLTQIERTSSVTREQALHLIAERESRLLSVYDSRTDAYLEGLAAKRPCPKEYLPVREGASSEGRLSYSFYAAEPGLRGGCAPEKARYRTSLSWLYCASDRSLYQIEETGPATAPGAGEPLRRWSCR